MSEALAIAAYSNYVPILYPTPILVHYIYCLKVSCATSLTYTLSIKSPSLSPEEMILGPLQACGLPPKKIIKDG